MPKATTITILKGEPGAALDWMRRQGLTVVWPSSWEELVKMAHVKPMWGAHTALGVKSKDIAVAIDVDNLRTALCHIYVVQGKSKDSAFRSLTRRSQVQYCDSPPLYKKDAWRDLIKSRAESPLSDEDVDVIYERSGGNETEIDRVLRLIKILGISASALMELDVGNPKIRILDDILRHKWVEACMDMWVLEEDGVSFQTVGHGLLTRLHRVLRIKASMELGLSDDTIIQSAKLVRMIAGNLLSEAKMNSIEFLSAVQKSIIEAIWKGELGYGALFSLCAATHQGV